MPVMPPTFRPKGWREKREREKDNDKARGTSRERGYSVAWDKASKGFRRTRPLCEYCALRGLVTAATLTDHLFPHRGDKDVFWFKPWWVASCKPCHDGPKQSIERQGQAAIESLARALGRPTTRGEGG